MITASEAQQRSVWWRVALAGLLAIPLVVFIFWVWERLTVTPAIRFEGPAFQLLAGEGASTQFGLQITKVAADGRAVVGLPMGGRDASAFDSLSFEIRGLEGATGAGIYWTRTDQPGVGIPRPFSLEEVREGRVVLSGFPGWEGRLDSVGFIVQGPLQGEVLFRAINLQPDKSTLLAVASRLVRQWSVLGDWDGGSVNFYVGAERTERRLTPALAATLWLFVVVLLWRIAILNRIGMPPLPAVLVAGFLVAWAALDLRWQTDLIHRHFTPSTDPLVATDRERARFWAENKAKIFSAEQRVFLVSNDPTSYVAYRTRYHLGAVRTSFASTGLPAEGQRRVGDYILILGSREPVRFDEASQRLSIGETTVAAKLIFNVPEAGALLQIRATGEAG